MKVSPESRPRDVITEWNAATNRAKIGADVPDTMTFLNGQAVKTTGDWQVRQEEIKRLWCDYFIGHFPKEAPALLSAKGVKEEETEDGSSRRRIALTFDTPDKRSFEIALWEPAASNINPNRCY